MNTTLTHTSSWLDSARDTVFALTAAVWPRSAAALDVKRLVDDGYTVGATYETAFSLDFEETGDGLAAVSQLGASRVIVGDRRDAAAEFITVCVPVVLTPYAVSLAAARVNRIAREHGGFATMIGPLEPPPAHERAADNTPRQPQVAA
jgi:hypothetical protein